jgi:hypothetical protein
MGKYAIIRADGTADKVEGSSVEDVATRYGAPGNGSIEPWNDNLTPANTFDTPEAQYAAWEKVATAEGQFKTGGAVKDAEGKDAPVTAGVVSTVGSRGAKLDPDEFTRDELEALATEAGVESPGSLPNKAALVKAINDAQKEG